MTHQQSFYLYFLTAMLLVNHAVAQNAALGASNDTTSMKTEHYTRVADNYLKYLTEKNLEGILSLYAADATVEDPVGSPVIRGSEALRKFYSGAVTMDLVLKRTGPTRVAGREMAFPFELLMVVDGVRTATDIIDVFRFDEEGRIISMRAFWGPHNRRAVE